jgi:hypothetical protein
MAAFDFFKQDFSLTQLEDKIDIFSKFQKYIYGVLVALISVYLFFFMVVPAFTIYKENRQ